MNVEHLSSNNFLRDFRFMKTVVKIVIDVWWNNIRNESVYEKKDSLFES